VTAVSTVHRRGPSRLARRRIITAYLCLLPWLVGFAVFTAYPIVASAYYSLTNYAIVSTPTWIGLRNYENMFRDPIFRQSLSVTVVFSVVAVPGSIVVGYLVAVLLNQRLRGLFVWRTLYFLPSIVPAIASAFLWEWIFDPNFGLINSLLRDVGIRGPGWFSSVHWVLPAFIIMYLWGAGGNLILYLAALQQIPTDLYESALVDGASAWSRLIRITIPLSSPVILFTFLTGVIASFQVFTAAYVITNGGPGNASLFYVLYLYRTGWQYFQLGYASALAWVLLIIMLAITLLSLWVSRRLVYYEYGR
jgi:multiple sugar transport system permease protein